MVSFFAKIKEKSKITNSLIPQLVSIRLSAGGRINLSMEQIKIFLKNHVFGS